MIQTNKSSQGGFALLITILTVGVVVSATLAIVELSRMQLKLSVDSRDAEIAFSAANAAKECAQYMRTTASSTISNGGQIRVNCLDYSSNIRAATTLGFGVGTSIGSNGDNVFRYTYDIPWEASGLSRCSMIDMIVVYATTKTITIGTGANTLQRVVSNYRSPTMTCRQGSQCTIIAASGYNTNCGNKNSPGVLKREVLLEF